MATTTASLEEELQVKNQQVKQYKRQVDAVKADLDKCQTELRIAHQQNTRLQNALVEGFSLGDPGAPIKTRSKRDDQMVQQLMCSMSEKISSSHVTDDMGGGEEENKKLIREAESLHQELATLRSQSATSSQMSPTLQFLANELKQQRASCTDVEIHLERLQMENRDLVEKCSGLTMQLETTRKTTATMYQEDFEHERKDRENLHGRLTQKEEELAIKEAELRCVRQQFEEELQTKNQQVKQYKRQVDAVKADLDKCQMELNQNTEMYVLINGRLIQKEEELARKEAELRNMRQQFEDELQTKNQQSTHQDNELESCPLSSLESGSLNALKAEPSFVNGTGEEASQSITRFREGHGEERSEVFIR